MKEISLSRKSFLLFFIEEVNKGKKKRKQINKNVLQHFSYN